MKKSQSIDGFVLRKDSESDSEGEKHVSKRVYLDGGNLKVQLPPKKDRHSKLELDSRSNSLRQKGQSSDALDLDRDIETSLSRLPSVAGDSTSNPMGHRSKRHRKSSKLDQGGKAKTKSKKRRLIKRLIISILILAVVFFAASFIWKAFGNIGKVFEGNPLDILTSNTPLDEDDNGRTNILMLGTSDDEVGHEGSYLTDSIMIVSIDQDKHDAYMISIPRDLWVKYGQACLAGYEGKINVAYSCFGGATGDIEKDRAALKKAIPFYSNITGIDIQYAVNLNYTVFRDAVNAVGGKITVNIQSRNSRGILDSNFDWKCGSTKAQKLKNCPPNGHFLQLPNGEQELDAEHALYLALARGVGAPTYGLEESNFDREQNQQLVIRAIMDKAKQVGIFSNPTTISSLLDSMGNNLRTTFGSKHINTLIKIAEDFDSDNMQSISLLDADPAVLTTGTVNGQSVVVPTAGRYDYSKLQAFIAKNLSNDPAIRENPTIYVYNGGAASGSAATVSDQLSEKGYNAVVKGNVDDDVDAKYAIYDLSSGSKTASVSALEKLFGVKAKSISSDDLPAGAQAGADILVVVGTQFIGSN